MGQYQLSLYRRDSSAVAVERAELRDETWRFDGAKRYLRGILSGICPPLFGGPVPSLSAIQGIPRRNYIETGLETRD